MRHAPASEKRAVATTQLVAVQDIRRTVAPALTDPSLRGSRTLNVAADELGRLLPRRSPEAIVRLRMALLSINAAVAAAVATDAPDSAVVGAARRMARLLALDLVADGEREG